MSKLNKFEAPPPLAPDLNDLSINDPSNVRYSTEQTASGEDRLALRFAEQYADRLRYVEKWGKWLIWKGYHWEEDGTRSVENLVRKICRAEAAKSNKPSEAAAISSAKTMKAVVSLARSDTRLARTTEDWDKDPWLLNTPNGVVDLKTGKTKPNHQNYHMMKITAEGPKGDCPRWFKFLEEVCNGDSQLIEYLQRMVGYILTGSTCEHALFFLYGTGANGKSVFIEAITGVLGNYHKTAPIETFTVTGVPSHPTDLAGLMGARLVTAVETEEGRRWAESKIKSLTGGDKISARFMRQDFFEFTPDFKLVIAGNHKPGLRSVDEAMRRRFHLIPFTVTIPLERRNKDLGEELKKEWRGILQWAIDGCLKWQREGLKPPPAVIDATNEYLEAEDSIAAWLAERCEINNNPNAWASSDKLYASWKSWAEASGEYVGTQKRLSEKLESRGIEKKRLPGKGTRGFRGICIKESRHSWE
jgi:putative DNA primase/helicase